MYSHVIAQALLIDGRVIAAVAVESDVGVLGHVFAQAQLVLQPASDRLFVFFFI